MNQCSFQKHVVRTLDIYVFIIINKTFCLIVSYPRIYIIYAILMYKHFNYVSVSDFETRIHSVCSLFRFLLPPVFLSIKLKISDAGSSDCFLYNCCILCVVVYFKLLLFGGGGRFSCFFCCFFLFFFFVFCCDLFLFLFLLLFLFDCLLTFCVRACVRAFC